MTPKTPRIRYEVDAGIALVTLDRPEARNAIDDGMRAEISAAVAAANEDDAVRALVITGALPSFCAGGDISAMRTRLEAPATNVAIPGWKRQRRLHSMLLALHEIEKPTIAAVNGAAAGLGCDLALCCDFVMAADTATFIMSYVLRGLIPDGGGAYWLPRRVGLARAKELIFTGRTVQAAEALSLGMADRMVPADRLIDEARAWATELSQHSLGAIGLAKTMLDRSFEMSPEDILGMGSQAQAIVYTTGEHRQSVEAFLNRGRERR